jgi:mannose-6-phosphate isomerase-like protein (cupin superfamily)
LKENNETRVHIGEEISWFQNTNHNKLEHREIVNYSDSGEIGIHLSSILWERIGVEGCVLAHYHDVAEIIHLTQGKVKLLCNGEWKSFKSGDTFLVPVGTIHSVANDDCIPSEQISIFLPAEQSPIENKQFKTFKVE